MLAVGRARADGPVDEARRSVESRAKAVGLGPLKARESARFLAIGDVSEAFLGLVLSDCEEVADDFARHFGARGFALTPPSRRMMVVALSGDDAYGRFTGEPASLASGGRYDLKADRLVVYDYRPARGRIGARVGRLNLLTLAHEVTHQLCFGWGLLDRAGDAPRSVVEGLATYAETRPPGPRPGIGRRNDTRLDDLAHLRRGTPWMPVSSLLGSDDALLGRLGGARLLLAYAQSWLLVYTLMTDPVRLPGFRAYLDAIRPRRDPSRRLADAGEHLGDLDRLDVELKAQAIRLQKSR